MSPRVLGLVGCLVGAALCGAGCEDEGAPPRASGMASPPSSAPARGTADTPTSFVPRCVDGDVRQQRHGATCLCCHAELGVAGSIDPSGPPVDRIVVTDAHGDVATMTPNIFANFFRHFTMTPPFRAVIYGPDGRSLRMRDEAPSSDCNACHSPDGPASPLHGP